MNCFEFAAANPWWALLYLMIVCVAVVNFAAALGPFVMVKTKDASKD